MAIAKLSIEDNDLLRDIRIEQAHAATVAERRFYILAIGMYTFGGATLILSLVSLLIVTVKL